MLHVHRADRADALTSALASVYAEPPPNPLAGEVLAVPTHGVERWLTQQLAGWLGARAGRADGVCANVSFPSPRRLIDETIAAANGVDPDNDPWVPQRLLWPLLEVTDAALVEPWLAPLSAHLQPRNGDRSRRLRTLAHLVVLYDRYAAYRPEMLRAWREADDVDGSGGPLGPTHRWQAELWRRTRDRIEAADPVEALDDACTAIVSDPDRLDLPARLAIFGLTALPGRHLRVLHALAAGRDVHLFLLHPSAASWDATAAALQHLDTTPIARADAATLLPDHPLLASWGRDARELQLVLAREDEHGTLRTDTHHPSPDAAETLLLTRLQLAIRADQPPAPPRRGEADDRPVLREDDRSLEIHACHGRARQVEVLRDAILHALEDDRELEPRDIIVMCPDIEAFAPLVEATFGAGEALVEATGLGAENPALDTAPSAVRRAGLRVRLADRALRQTNPMLALVSRLFALTGGRLAASDVLDLVDREPVRHRFRLDRDDIAQLEEWTRTAGIRWGLDASGRDRFGLGTIAEGTWDAGLDRLAAGVALAEDGPERFEGVLPLDDVDSSSIELAGRFAELLERLGVALQGFIEPKSVAEWATAIAAAADALGSTRPSDAWQRAELERLLQDVVAEATRGDTVSPAVLDVADVAALLEDRLAGRPTRIGFRTGHLTVCTLQPMRSVPHRVVCLLGLDDSAFPRRSRRDGDDILLLDSQVGDRDPRAEDRQILLDALLAATDRVIITYTGNDERTNAPRSPAVPVGELLDIVDRTARGPDASPASELVLVRHPLHDFAARNFEHGALREGTPWSFDAATLEGARIVETDRVAPASFLDGPLPPLSLGTLDLDDLVEFVGHPVRAFLAQRLEIRMAREDETFDDALPVDLDGFQRWAIGQRLLEARLRGADARAAIAAERARGALPPGRIGRATVMGMATDLRAILTTATNLGLDVHAASTTVDARVALPGDDSTVVSGTVAGLAGEVLQTVTFSRVSARQRLGAWVRILLLTAAYPDRPFSAVTVGRARRSATASATVTIARIAPLDGEPGARRARALHELAKLVDLHARGMTEPLPIFCETSAAYAAGSAAAARRAWESPFGHEHEDRDELHVMVFGRDRTYESLFTERPHEDERGDGWAEDEPSRFGRLAHRLWSGLRTVEQVSDA
jgi:exodeoxyribonuclease V gamma subunit